MGAFRKLMQMAEEMQHGQPYNYSSSVTPIVGVWGLCGHVHGWTVFMLVSVLRHGYGVVLLFLAPSWSQNNCRNAAILEDSYPAGEHTKAWLVDQASFTCTGLLLSFSE